MSPTVSDASLADDPSLSPDRAAELVEGARWELSQGHIATAETLCRVVLDQFADQPDCWNMIGVIAAQIGLFGQAAAAFRRALAAEPGFEHAADNLRMIEAAPAPPRRQPDAGGILLIKALGQGFWSDVDHVLGQLLIAEITGRVPIVHWGANSRFGAAEADDAFTLYFEPLSPVRLKDLRDRPDGAFWPPKWSARNLDAGDVHQFEGPWSRVSGLLTLGRPEEIVVSDSYTGIATIAAWIPPGHALSGLSLPALYRYLCRKYLSPRRDIASRVEELHGALFAGRRVLAVHARGTDKVDENRDIDAVNARLLDEAAAWAARVDAERVLLLSDSAAIVARFRGVLGDRLITLDVQRSDSDRALHFQARDGYALGRDVMWDTYLASRADWFLGNGDSNISAMVEHLRDWPEDRFRLVRPNVHYRRHLV